jgi:hypothetical protein
MAPTHRANHAPPQVILVEDYGLEVQPRPRPNPQPLVLMNSQRLLVHLAKESAAYWRGLEMTSGASMLRTCPAVAFGPGGSSDAAAERLERVRQACAEAGVPLGALATQELAGSFGGSIRLPNGYATLVQERGGGLLLPVEAGAALGALCKQAGVVVRDSLLLRGWRDAGGHFVVRASSRLMPDALSVFEAEQLLLAPGHWVPSSWALFGLGSKLSTLQVACSRVAAGSDLRKAPIWHWLGDDRPSGGGSGGGGGVSSVSGGNSGSSSSSSSNSSGAALGAAAAFSPTSERPGLPSCVGLPLLSEGARAILQQCSWAGQALEGPAGFQQQPAAGQLAAARQVHEAAAQHVRGLGDWELASSSCQVMHGTEDGVPVVGYHPGGWVGRPLTCPGGCCGAGLGGRRGLLAAALHMHGTAAAACRARGHATARPPAAPQGTRRGGWPLPRLPAAAARRLAWATAATSCRLPWARRRPTC